MSPEGKAQDTEALARAARRVAEDFGVRGATLATAESCTGGWVAKCLTDVPGSSAWFRGGVVAYSNALKETLLGVPSALLERHGAVSEEAARAMAEGALALADVDAALAVTGIAGPEGGSADKPVGTVWFAWARRGRAPRTAVEHFPGGREAVRRAAVARALEGLLDE